MDDDIPKQATDSTPATSPTESEDSLLDPPDYIPPDQQDMMLMDITSDILHSSNGTVSIGRGEPYLSEADVFPQTWPAYGTIYGYNKRLMISLPCRRVRPNRNHKVLNVYFLVDTGSPCSYLCRETFDALIDKPGCALPKQLEVVVKDESCPMIFHMSPLGTPEEPGKFRDVNVLGMDFLLQSKVTMVVDSFVNRFRLVAHEPNLARILAEYPDGDN